jgi:hypothetical protein
MMESRFKFARPYQTAAFIVIASVSEAIQTFRLDCFVATLLAMTIRRL